MLGFEAGTCNGSDLYFQSPSEQARSMLFYMTSCGYYYTDKDYRIDRSRYPAAAYVHPQRPAFRHGKSSHHHRTPRAVGRSGLYATAPIPYNR